MVFQLMFQVATTEISVPGTTAKMINDANEVVIDANDTKILKQRILRSRSKNEDQLFQVPGRSHGTRNDPYEDQLHGQLLTPDGQLFDAPVTDKTHVIDITQPALSQHSAVRERPSNVDVHRSRISVHPLLG